MTFIITSKSVYVFPQFLEYKEPPIFSSPFFDGPTGKSCYTYYRGQAELRNAGKWQTTKKVCQISIWEDALDLQYEPLPYLKIF
jgi:hypothetical protein